MTNFICHYLAHFREEVSLEKLKISLPEVLLEYTALPNINHSTLGVGTEWSIICLDFDAIYLKLNIIKLSVIGLAESEI